MERLIGFARSGTVDGIALGATEDEVRSRLGAPADVGRAGRIWKYGPLELAFVHGRVAMVLLTVDDGVGLDAVERALGQGHIPYEADPELTFDTQTTLRIPSSGVRLTFDTERGDRLVKAVLAAGG